MIACGKIPGAIQYKKKNTKRNNYYINDEPFMEWMKKGK